MMGRLTYIKGLTKVTEAGAKQDVFNVVHKPVYQNKMLFV